MTKFPFKLQESLFLFLKTETGNPFAFQVEVKKLYLLVCTLLILFFTFLSGTVLFFRELDLNRRLQDKLLLVDMREKIHEPSATAPVTPLAQALSPVIETAAEVKPEKKAREVIPEAQSEAPPPELVAARMSDFTVECGAEECSSRVSMVPTSTGIAQGELVLILETEVPRIGGTNPEGQVRKRYFIYPGYQTRDELDESAINQLSKKTFRFSRAIQTTAVFNIGKLLRPVGLNIYLYDSNKVLIHHERKPIETDDSYGH
jgi:hypothetical protein